MRAAKVRECGSAAGDSSRMRAPGSAPAGATHSSTLTGWPMATPGELLLWQGDGHLAALTIGGEGEGGLPSGNHLAHFHLALGNHPAWGALQCTA